jgi:hypothetical protein
MIKVIEKNNKYGILENDIEVVPCCHPTKESALGEWTYFEKLNVTGRKPFLDHVKTIEEIDKIASELIQNGNYNNDNTVLCPIELFRYFIRKLYKDVDINNDDIDEINNDFSNYLNDLNLTDFQKENILPKSTFDVLLNSSHPFRVEGFPPAFVIHFDQFIEKEKAKSM